MKRFAKGDPEPQISGGHYRKRTVVRLWGPMAEPFECETREGVLSGQAGDYCAADGHGGYYPISSEFLAENYELVEPVCTER